MEGTRWGKKDRWRGRKDREVNGPTGGEIDRWRGRQVKKLTGGEVHRSEK